MDFLGKGTFGQVAKCLRVSNNQLCAVKVIKSKTNYFNQGKTEIKILHKLNERENQKINNNHLHEAINSRIVKMIDYFFFRNHLFIVFELLDISLYDLITGTNYQGFCLTDISSFTKQIVEGLKLVEECKIIHCDLKPENILFAR